MIAATCCPTCGHGTADVEFSRDDDGYTITWLTCQLCDTLWRLE
jgi:hypothetical protein